MAERQVPSRKAAYSHRMEDRRLDLGPPEVIEVPVAAEPDEGPLRWLATAISFALAVFTALRVYDDLLLAALLALVFGAVTHFPFWLASRFFGRGAVYFYLQWQQDRRGADLAAAVVFTTLSTLAWILLGVVLYALYLWAPGS